MQSRRCTILLDLHSVSDAASGLELFRSERIDVLVSETAMLLREVRRRSVAVFDHSVMTYLLTPNALGETRS